MPHSVVRSERVHVGCDSIAPVVEMRAKSHERPNVEVPLIGSRQGERGCEITPTWARSGPRYVATAPHVGDPPRTAITAISAIITGATPPEATPLDRTAPGVNVGALGPRYVATARTWRTRRSHADRAHGDLGDHRRGHASR